MSHAILVGLAYLSAFFVNDEFFVSKPAWDLFLTTVPLLLLVRLGAFASFHLLDGLWRYVSMRDMRNTQGVPDCGMRNAE